MVYSFFSDEFGAAISVQKDTLVALSGVYFESRPFSTLILVGNTFDTLLAISFKELGKSANLLIVLLPESMLDNGIEVSEYHAHDGVSFLRQQLISHLVVVLDLLNICRVRQLDLEEQIQLNLMLCIV